MRFTEPGMPYISASDSSNYVAYDDGNVRGINSEGIYIPSFLMGFIVCTFALIILAYSVSTIVINKQMQMSDDPCPGDFGDTVELGNGLVYCTAEDWNYYHEKNQISQIETAENRFKITYEDKTTEYRWESIDDKTGLVVIGEMYEDGYMSCRFYFAENELPDDFGTSDLYLGENTYYLGPSWCNDFSSASEDVIYSSDVPYPFLGVKMYEPMQQWNYNDELWFEVTTNSSTEYYVHLSSEYVEYIIAEEIIIGFVLLFVSFIVMLKIDQRRFVLKFDVEGKSMSFRRSMTATRWGGWSWSDVDYSSAELKKLPDSVRLWMMIEGEKRFIAEFHGQSAQGYIGPLKQLLNIPETRITTSISSSLPRLEMFDVLSWDSDRDAEPIYEFYLQELGSSEGAKTLDELYEGAGIASLSNYHDAQKLLNHVIELLDPDFTAPQVVANQTQIVEYQGIPSKKEPTDVPSESTQLDAFWTTEDSDGN